MFELPARLDFKNSKFASKTISERWPVILSQLIDSLYRNRGYYESDRGISLDAIKSLTGAVAHLRYELSTDKPIRYLQSTSPIESECTDTATWNHYLSVLIGDSNVEGNATIRATTWHNLPWLFAECYLYRRIIESLAVNGLFNFDPFAVKKQAGFSVSKTIILCFLQYLTTVLQSEEELGAPDLKTFIEASLWANEFDLSLHPDMDKQDTASKSSELPVYLQTLHHRIVVDDSDALERIWLARSHAEQTVAIVLDNAGPELVADLCLGEYLISKRLANRIVFYPKRWPWFVSDVIPSDITWLLESAVGLTSIGSVGAEWASKWRNRFETGTFTVYTSDFWTLPCGYSQLEEQDPILYAKLASSGVVFFKGDLNYRKLLDDRHWLPDRPEHKMEAFRPLQFDRSKRDGNLDGSTPTCRCSSQSQVGEMVDGRCPIVGSIPPLVVALRIAKADVAVGLTSSVWSSLCAQSVDWWTSGQFGMLQLVSPLCMDS